MYRVQLAIVFLCCSSISAWSTDQRFCTARASVSIIAGNGKDQFVARRVSSSDLRVTLNGRQTDINTLRAHPARYRFIVMLDHSGSMHPKWWKPAVMLAEQFAERLNENSQAGLIVFNDSIEQEAPLQEAVRVLNGIKKLEDMEPKGRTALFSTLRESVRLLEPAEQGDVVYVLTDGGDNRSEFKFRDLQQQFQREGIRLFAVVFSDEQPLSVEERAGIFQLRELASISGGDSITFQSPSDIAGMTKEIERIYAEMVYEFTLELKVPEPFKKQMRLKVNFTGSHEPKLHFSVLHPANLFPDCSSH